MTSKKCLLCACPNVVVVNRLFVRKSRAMVGAPIDSEVSIGFPALASPHTADRPSGSAALSPEKVNSLDNVCCLLLHCKAHRRLVIKRNATKGVFLPYITYGENDSWRKVSCYLIKGIFDRLAAEEKCSHLKYSEAEMFDIYRVQCAKTRQFYTRITVMIEMEPLADTSRCYCRVSTPTITWLGGDEIASFVDKFWGPEVILFYAVLQEPDRPQRELSKSCETISVLEALRLLNGKSKVQECEMLAEAKYTARIVVRLYNEFLCHCYPSRFMSLASFKAFMLTKLSFPDESNSLQAIFRTFNYRGTNFLCFDEFLLGLAAMDTLTPHSDASLLLRLSYLFRYYNSESNGKMSLTELTDMNQDIVLKNNKPHTNPSETKEIVQERMNAYFTDAINRQTEASLSQAQFVALAAAESNFCRLTSTIFRARFNIVQIISNKFDFESTAYGEQPLLALMIEQAKYNKTCQVCRDVRFRLASNAVRLTFNGEVTTLINLAVQHMKPTSENSSEKLSFAVEIRSNELNTLAVDILNRVMRVAIQTFEKCDLTAETQAWYYDNKQLRTESIKKFLQYFKEQLQCDKFVSVSAPCFVISSLFGNLKDLFIYEHLLWKSSPHLNPTTNLFLGNIVGGHPWSMECIIYLFCMKTLMPQRFVLLRGHQETRDKYENKSTNFFTDCHTRFDSEVWSLLHQIFDQLPLGATIEEKIFCSSSGFPKSKKSLQSMNATLDRTLAEPMNLGCVKDILWADAFNKADMGSNEEEDAFRQFLQINRLCALIRSHSVPAADTAAHVGNLFYFNYKAISLYSSSNLQKLRNNTTSSIALVTREQICLARVETFLPTWQGLFQ